MKCITMRMKLCESEYEIDVEKRPPSDGVVDFVTSLGTS